MDLETESDVEESEKIANIKAKQMLLEKSKSDLHTASDQFPIHKPAPILQDNRAKTQSDSLLSGLSLPFKSPKS